MNPIDLASLLKKLQAWSPEKLFNWLWDIGARCVRAFTRLFWKAVDFTRAGAALTDALFDNALPHVLEAERQLAVYDSMIAQNKALEQQAAAQLKDDEELSEEDEEALLMKRLQAQTTLAHIAAAREEYTTELRERKELEVIEARIAKDNAKAAAIEAKYNHVKAVDDCLEVLVFENNEAKNLEQLSLVKDGKYTKAIKTVRPGQSLSLIRAAVDMIRCRHMVPDSSFTRVDEAAIRATALDFCASFNMDVKTTRIVVSGVMGICCVPDPEDIHNLKVAYHPTAIQMRDLVTDLRGSLPSFTAADF
nr:MAG: hypothetical protein [Guiyang Paspalum paspaloides tombus-like virus 2]